MANGYLCFYMSCLFCTINITVNSQMVRSLNVHLFLFTPNHSKLDKLPKQINKQNVDKSQDQHLIKK